MTAPAVLPGDVVRIAYPEIPWLDGRTATVDKLFRWCGFLMASFHVQQSTGDVAEKHALPVGMLRRIERREVA